MATAFKHAVHQNLECPVCLGFFQEPKILSCSHTFCKGCLETLCESYVNKDKLSCPVCREETSVPSGDVSTLQTNIALRSLVADVETQVQVCANCDLTLAVAHCSECGVFLCETCKEMHSKWAMFSGHSLIAASDIMSGKIIVKRRSKCQKHPNEGEECFCQNCSKYVCFRCGMLEHAHEGHKIVQAEIHETEQKKNIDQMTSKATAKVRDLDKYITLVEGQYEKLQELETQVTSEIDEAFEEAVLKLTERKALLKREVGQKMKELKTELVDMKGKYRQQTVQVNAVCQLVKNGLKIPLQKEALTTHDTLCQELEELLGSIEHDDDQPRRIVEEGERIKFKKGQKSDGLELGHVGKGISKGIVHSEKELLNPVGREVNPEEKRDIHFQPIVKLPGKVELVTGGEQEVAEFVGRGKLYRFDRGSKQWKERGVGDIKIMKDEDRDVYRIFMRRDQIHKVCANHYIMSSMVLHPMSGSDRAWVWHAMDAADGEPTSEQLAIKFKEPSIAAAFKEKFEEAQTRIRLREAAGRDDKQKANQEGATASGSASSSTGQKGDSVAIHVATSSSQDIEYNWRQTDEGVYIEFNLNGVIKKEDVELKLDTSGNTCVCQICFKDGSKWVCSLQHTVLKSSANVKVKDGALILHLQKKEKYKEWKLLGDCVFNKAREVDVGKANENRNLVEESSINNRNGEGEIEGMKDVKEEEEYEVNHVKHDFFSRQDLKVLYLHVYVKKIEKESVVVTYEENGICIKFKTNDNRFLQLNPGGTPDTLFCWRIRTWKPIDPEGCQHKVTENNLEVNIKKQKAEKWKALECSTKDQLEMKKRKP